MICTRVLLCILMMLFTACGVCAALFPLMRRTGRDDASHKVKYEVYLWYTESKYTDAKTHVYERIYHRQRNCGEFRTAAVAGAALDVVGCGVGAIACILAAVHICARVKFHLCCTLMVLCFVAFATLVASLATVVFTFRGDSCPNDTANAMRSFHGQDYKLVEGFILLCIAAGGFFITTFLEMLS
ncbi:hypothetical protein ABB37_06642 [Leptomonas pyrrhocoris]|uniref:Amastin-like surface protein-like protein n=1 Tax=Leptomonas pyrrhocoris TaxID=157538 RepID=A0A0N0VEA4_LEPPY|nr:hypothetical protein ABB37_06642 [Leptomonas pyrrhocoris]KPA77828.1 hypothetical protein ABB37_06642 [Leptomonas pyrrhocoris]|eukprot:XP_015656267.1 hypothetical protein ABB37_06642 [Leptomonas pyrrhocoris]